MGKTIGLLMAVVAIWATVEIYTNGMGGAFGGRLVSLGLVGEDERSREPATERVRETVQRAHDDQEARYDSLLEE
jgi:hypothetical protein